MIIQPHVPMQPQWEFLTRTIYDPTVFWAMVAAVGTILLVVATVALVLVGIIPFIRIQKASLTERFREELLTPSAQKTFFLAAHGLLRFNAAQPGEAERIPYFEIISVEPAIFAERLNQIVNEQRIVMTFELDDQILSPLEEVAYYEERRELEFEDVFRVFADHLDICFSNSEIMKYIEWIRQKQPSAYTRAEKLHQKAKEYDSRRHSK